LGTRSHDLYGSLSRFPSCFGFFWCEGCRLSISRPAYLQGSPKKSSYLLLFSHPLSCLSLGYGVPVEFLLDALWEPLLQYLRVSTFPPSFPPFSGFLVQILSPPPPEAWTLFATAQTPTLACGAVPVPSPFWRG